MDTAQEMKTRRVTGLGGFGERVDVRKLCRLARCVWARGDEDEGEEGRSMEDRGREIEGRRLRQSVSLHDIHVHEPAKVMRGICSMYMLGLGARSSV